MGRMLLALVLLVVGCKADQRPATAPVSRPSGVQVYFSPRGGCTDAIVREISAATSLPFYRRKGVRCSNGGNAGI